MAQELYGFFSGTPDDARSYDDARFSSAMRTLATDGVADLDDCLAVSAEGGTMRVLVSPGRAAVQGYFYELQDDGGAQKALTLTADSTYDRVARIVLRLSLDARAITLLVRLGAAEADAQPPALVRTATSYELSLARVRVRAGATAIAESDVTDERADESVCGAIAPGALRLSRAWERLAKANATSSAAGLMSAADKQYLDALSAVAAPSAEGLDLGGKYIDNALFR